MMSSQRAYKKSKQETYTIKKTESTSNMSRKPTGNPPGPPKRKFVPPFDPKKPDADRTPVKKWSGSVPEKQIDLEQILYWIEMQATQQEIAASFRMDIGTLDAYLKEGFGLGFSQLKEKVNGTGKLSLRRYQFKQAENNATMAIWLGKCWLGQTDVTEKQLESTKQRELDLSYENAILRNKLRESEQRLERLEKNSEEITDGSSCGS